MPPCYHFFFFSSFSFFFPTLLLLFLFIVIVICRYYSVVAYLLGGKPLQWIVVIVAVCGSAGTILSGMCCNAYSVKVSQILYNPIFARNHLRVSILFHILIIIMIIIDYRCMHTSLCDSVFNLTPSLIQQMLGDLNMLPKAVGWMYPKFNSPVVAIGIIMSITSSFAFFFNWSEQTNFFADLRSFVNACRYSINGGGNAFDNAAFASSLLSLFTLSLMLIAFLVLRHKVYIPHQARIQRWPISDHIY